MLERERAEEPSLFPSSFAMKPFQKDPAKQDRYDRYLALVKEGVKGESAAKVKHWFSLSFPSLGTVRMARVGWEGSIVSLSSVLLPETLRLAQC